MGRGAPLEGSLQAKIRKGLVLRYGPCFSFKLHVSNFQTAGIPDIIACIKGRFVALEVKRPGKENELSALQADTIEKIKASGGIAGMVTSLEQAIELIDLGLKKKPR